MTRQLLLLLLAVSPAWAQPAVGWPKEGEPAYPTEQAVAWRDEMAPLVEQAAGRAFESTPEVRVVTREQLHESVLDDAMLVNQTDDAFARVLAPKVTGGHNLHRATLDRGDDLDAFVLFSSISGTTGAATAAHTAISAATAAALTISLAGRTIATLTTFAAPATIATASTIPNTVANLLMTAPPVVVNS